MFKGEGIYKKEKQVKKSKYCLK